jgi:Protein of unknown function (DUF2630)
MDDRNILQRISALVAEEHGLANAHHEGPISEDDQRRMQELEVTLDQCWDLLRQRRARRHAGQDPGEAEVRPPSVVENYKQ